MATTIGGGVSFLSPRVLHQNAEIIKFPHLVRTRSTLIGSGRVMRIRPVRAAPESISKKVEESIKNAKETCSDDPASGECVAAWDEVEELSAAASHARDRKKESDPLEDYCKDNPETKECKTFED